MAIPQTTHPLVRHGTNQRERLSEALIPGNLRLDDRSLADLVAFVAKFAKHVRFWPTPADDTGDVLDWSCFWNKDATVLLAIVAATDINSFRTQYRDHELTYYRAKKKVEQGKPLDDGEPTPEESIAQLVITSFQTARQIVYLCGQIPASHPLKAEVVRIISDKLKTPLHQLIEFHKGVADRNLDDDYKPFIGWGTCQSPWGMPSIDDFFCIDVRPPQDTDLDTLWRLFLTFANALAVLVTKAGKAFQYALHSRSDHPPHVALMLSFLNLFRYLQNDLNTLPEKHLFYYYHDVLRLALRAATPDRAYLVFTIAQNIDQYRLKKGTLFLGGKDRLGIDRLYALENELVINKAKLVEKKTLYFYKGNSETPLADPTANLPLSPQGIATDSKVWSAFGPKAIYQDILQKITRLQEPLRLNKLESNSAAVKLQETLVTQATSLKTRLGLIVASPELRMDKSDGRFISLKLDSDSQTPLPFRKNNTNAVRIQLSSADALIPLSFDSDSSLFLTTANEVGVSSPIDFSTILDGDSTMPSVASFQVEGNEIRIFLPTSFPALAPYTGKEEPNLTSIPYPFIIVQTEQPGDYDRLRDAGASTVSLQTASRNLKDLTLQLGDTVFASNAEIPLIGATSQPVTTSLYITTPDLSAKVFKEDSIHLSNTNPTGGADSPQITISSPQVLLNGQWQDEKKEHSTVPFYGSEATTPRLAYRSNSPLTFLRIDITIPAPASKQPINIFKIAPESLSISYTSKGTSFPNASDETPILLYHALPFGGYVPLEARPFTLAPVFRQPLTDPLAESKPLSAPSAGGASVAPEPVDDSAQGNLFLGFEELVPGQTLSLLFQMAEGTGDPDLVAPNVVWSYLRSNAWVRFPPAFILTDETIGLQQTGLITFQLPTDINNQNTYLVGGKPDEALRKDLFWIRASATEGVDAEGKPNEIALIDALPLLIDIHTQAGSVVFENHGNSLEHLEKGIPANTIAQLRFRDVNVRQVAQPYPSFGGQLPEDNDRTAYYRRISERLRHRQRAVTVWDYERLVLEKYPKIALVKCLPHTGDDDVTRAGQVTVAVVPYPATLAGNYRFYPSVNAGQLTAIEEYLNTYNSFFVSGKGSSTTCRCHHDDPTVTDEPCGCQPESTLRVRSAVFEPIRLDVCVRFRPGKDPIFYRNELNKALRTFLAPWATDASSPILFGASISTTQLLRFLENTDYVDVITKLNVIHYPTYKAARADEQQEIITFPDEIIPFTSRSVLTTYLNSLDEDNPNAIDHIINVIETNDVCACADCQDTSKP